MLLTIFLVPFLSLHAQKNDLQRMKLNDQVKSIHETFYKVDNNNDQTNKNKPSYTYINEFDKNGNKTVDKRLDSEGELVKKYVYTYKNGKRISLKQYNEADSLIRKVTYTYDDQGNLIEDNSYAADGSHNKKYTYTYDKRGILKEDKSFDSEGSLLKKYTYKRNDVGNKIETMIFNADGSLEKKITYKYNEHGHLSGEKTYNRFDKVIYKFSYSYDYDQENNWTLKKAKKNEQPAFIIKREISYY